MQTNAAHAVASLINCCQKKSLIVASQSNISFKCLQHNFYPSVKPGYTNLNCPMRGASRKFLLLQSSDAAARSQVSSVARLQENNETYGLSVYCLNCCSFLNSKVLKINDVKYE